ncbi:MAG TPA: UDP-N-acetylmuramoyl-L-alanine--D-glutamate ligase, partial [Geminicoccaceae bacterium]
LAAARALKAAGAEVLAFDDQPEALARAAAHLGLKPGGQGDVAGLALLVPSPGVPLTHPRPHLVIEVARAAGVPIRGDVDLFAEVARPRPIVGVTGTNGKSTTTALIHHLLATAGVDAARGGNIGEAVFDLDLGPETRVLVLELSSFQLDLCERLRPRVAVWLNLTPDHLDRHGDLDGYARAKRRIFAGQGDGDTAVVGVDDAPSRGLADELAAQGRRVLRVSVGAVPDGGVGVRDGVLVDATDGAAPRDVLDLAGLGRLRGRHNHQNAAVAYAACRALGLSAAAATEGFPSFAGLPHRLEEVARAGGVVFVNDSKATNPDATARALESYADIFWIAGGRPKPGGFASLRPLMASVRGTYLIGEAAAEIERDVGDLAPVERSGTLEVAVAAAAKAARASGLPGAAVLLAPACASYDQFANFEARGDAFRALARAAAAAEGDVP